MNEKIIRDVLDNRASTMDADAVAAWFATPEGQQELGRLLDERFDELENRSQPLAREIPSEAIYRSIDRDIQRSKWRHWALRAAAVVIPLLIVVAGGVYLDRQFGGALFAPTTFVEQVADRGERIRIAFQDGTTVFLNAGSTIEYPKRFGWRERSVTLSGEAYFEVAKNHSKPFIVKLKNQQITVLGTSFNIQAFNDDRFSVTTLLSGSILLESFDAQGRKMSSMKLKPNQQARSDNRTGSIFLSETDASISNAWVGGKYRFKDETLVSIVKRLENYYGVNIRLAHDSLRNIRYTGTFSLDQGIQEVLDIINSEKQFTFMKDGKDILISARSK